VTLIVWVKEYLNGNQDTHPSETNEVLTSEVRVETKAVTGTRDTLWVTRGILVLG